MTSLRQRMTGDLQLRGLRVRTQEAYLQFARRFPSEAYSAMFRASGEAMKTLAADPKRLGAKEIGFFGVLQTWGRDLNYHPHVHYVVPGGGIDEDGEWRSTAANFFLPCEPLSILYREKLRAALNEAGLLQEVDPAVWEQSWIVDCKAVGDGAAAVQYLAAYVFRVAISDERIVSCDDDTVTFRYRPSGSRRDRTMTLEAAEFVRRFLQHVLPPRLQKVRHYGLLSPRAKRPLVSTKWLVALALGRIHWMLWLVEIAAPPAADVVCAECGGAMFVVEFIPSPTPSRLRSHPPPRSQDRHQSATTAL